MNNGTATTRMGLREAASSARPVPVPNAALLQQAGEYSLIQLEALSGIALKQATRKLRLSSTAS